MRIDTTLVGFDQMSWQRGRQSFVFKGESKLFYLRISCLYISFHDHDNGKMLFVLLNDILFCFYILFQDSHLVYLRLITRKRRSGERLSNYGILLI